MAKGLEKSVITTDMEGRIETFGDGSERMFGYTKKELIGKRRISLFSPGRVVLEHVPKWLAIASTEGEHVTRTVFLRKDGSPFAAEIRITPTYKDGVQNGFCGVTEELEDVKPEEVAPNISFMTKVFSWLVITRAPFLTAVVVPILIGAALSFWRLKKTKRPSTQTLIRCTGPPRSAQILTALVVSALRQQLPHLSSLYRILLQ